MARASQQLSEIARNKNTQGFTENKQAAKMGGKIAGDARKKLELESGKKVVSQENFLSSKDTKNLDSKKIKLEGRGR